jgi:membrane peptidoglycan carboxypeptidase
LDPIAVLKIESSDGKLLWQAKKAKERIVPANTAYLVTDILKDDAARVSMFGANSPLNLAGRPAAVKSGSSDETRDLWAIGYTPQLVTGVWVGNANNKPMTGATSAYVAAPIWNAFMAEALKGKPVMQFAVPAGIEFANVCQTTGQAPTGGCPTVKEVFLSGRLPGGVKSLSAQPAATQVQPARTATQRQGGFSGGLLPTPTPRLSGGPSGGLLPTPTKTPESQRQGDRRDDDGPRRGNPQR